MVICSQYGFICSQTKIWSPATQTKGWSSAYGQKCETLLTNKNVVICHTERSHPSKKKSPAKKQKCGCHTIKSVFYAWTLITIVSANCNAMSMKLIVVSQIVQLPWYCQVFPGPWIPTTLFQHQPKVPKRKVL